MAKSVHIQKWHFKSDDKISPMSALSGSALFGYSYEDAYFVLALRSLE